jgi:cytochrome c peroxidase
MKSSVLLLLSLMLFWVLSGHFRAKNLDQEVSDKVQIQIVLGLKNFNEALHALKKVHKTKNLRKTQFQFLKTREAFKRIEFIISYFDHPDNRKFNQANLVTNAYHIDAPNEQIDPRGLQVLEGLIYSEEADSLIQQEVDFLIDLSSDFLGKYQQKNTQEASEYHKLIWDALRSEIFRIEAMGITGFDVPICKNSLPETKEALLSMREIIQIYRPLIVKKTNQDTYRKGINLVDQAAQYLARKEFESFDRMYFITHYLHPISTWLTVTRNELDYSIPNNVQPIDANAYTLFDENVFNQNYFAFGSSPDKVDLGKKLFYDPLLSSDGSRSCASCHKPSQAFADGLVKNLSIDGTETLLRNTPSLWNAVYQTKQFYDSRASKLEKQALEVIHNKLEMGGDFQTILKAIQENPDYKSRFKKAFNGNISERTVLEALSYFVKSITSFNSRFDQHLRGKGNVLTQEEKDGFNLFMGKAACATCHFPPMFNGLVPPKYVETESEIIGVPIHAKQQNQIDLDLGKYLFTGLDIHRFSFKTPGVRNVEKTAPYMHNGVFKTLEEVLDFYNNGGGVGNKMDLPNQTLSGDSLQLSSYELNALVSFLKSLTDESKLEELTP